MQGSGTPAHMFLPQAASPAARLRPAKSRATTSIPPSPVHDPLQPLKHQLAHSRRDRHNAFPCMSQHRFALITARLRPDAQSWRRAEAAALDFANNVIADSSSPGKRLPRVQEPIRPQVSSTPTRYTILAHPERGRIGEDRAGRATRESGADGMAAGTTSSPRWPALPPRLFSDCKSTFSIFESESAVEWRNGGQMWPLEGKSRWTGRHMRAGRGKQTASGGQIRAISCDHRPNSRGGQQRRSITEALQDLAARDGTGLTGCSTPKLAGFGGVALFTVIFFASGIPRVQDDILKVRGRLGRH